MSGHPNLNLGQIITTPQQKDATHVAVAPVTAGENLKPGTHVMITTDGRAVRQTPENCIAIVDPFLRAPVKLGERFWVFIYPNTVTSLRHDWSHPMFPDQQAWENIADTGKKRMMQIASDLGLTYDKLIEGAKDWIAHGERLHEGPLLEGAVVPDDFWEVFNKVTGTHVPDDKVTASFFSCSC